MPKAPSILTTIDQTLDRRRILTPWLPLVAMWMVMAVEQPAITSVIARLPDVTTELAAFGLTFSLALLIESPIIQLLAAGTAIPDTKEKYRRLLRFMHFLAVILTAIHAILALPPVFTLVTSTLMGIPDEIVRSSNRSFAVMLPWSAAIGYRRLMQGVLIKFGQSRLIPKTMYVRLFLTGAVLAIGLLTGFGSGSVVGGLALSFGTIGGAAASYYYLKRAVEPVIPSGEGRPDGDISWRELIRFYIPLALTSIITLGARPLLSIGLARGLMPRQSLAVWPVVTGFSFLFHAIALSYQEIAISMIRGPQSKASLTSFAREMSLVLGGLFLLVALSPLRNWWFSVVAGLDSELLPVITAPLVLLVPFSMAAAIVSLYRGRLVFAKRTKYVSIAVGINSVVMLTVMFAGTAILPFPGVTVAALAFSTAIIVEAFYLAVMGTRYA